MSPAWKEQPGPKGLPVLGNFLEFRRDMLGFITKCRSYGTVSCFKLGPMRAWLFCEPELVRQVQVLHASSFQKEPSIRLAGRHYLGKGLLTAEGREHARQRQASRPSMLPGKVKDYLPEIHAVAAELAEAWAGKPDLELFRAMAVLALRVAGRSFFGPDLGGDAEEFAKAMERGLKQLKAVLVSPWREPWLYLSPSFRRDRLRVAQGLKGLVAGAREGSFAEAIQKAPGLSARHIHDSCLAVLLAGAETTAAALAWALWQLAQHPEQQELCALEGERFLSRGGLAQDLDGLATIRGSLLESMRLMPPVWMQGRQAVEDCELPGASLRAGDLVYMPQFLLHRDPRYFGDPDAFVPQRWSEAFEKGLPPFAYYPFGGGPRSCIAEEFAMLEMRVALAHILSRCRFRAETAELPPLNPFITLRPQFGLKLRIHRRESPLT